MFDFSLQMENNRTNETYKPFAKLGQFMKQVLEDDETLDYPNLHRVARDGNEAQLKILISGGCDVNAEDGDGLTALYIATKKGYTKVVKTLLQNGALVNTKYNPLLVVRDLVSARLLVQSNGDLHANDEFGDTPLQRAIMLGNETLVEFYLSADVDIHHTNAKGQTALHTLCSSFMKEPHGSNLIRTLVGRGASVNCKDSQDRSPLHLATTNYFLEKYETINVLIKSGASLSDLDLQGLTPVHHFVEKSRGCSDDAEEVSRKFIDCLIVNEQAANLRTAIGQTILHLAIRDIPIQILVCLVKKGCMLSVKDSRKQGLLHYIVDREDAADVLKYLINMGINVNEQDLWGQTVLHLAVMKNNKKLVEAVVDLGADVNMKDSVKKQPIHIAAENGWDCVLELLIQKGADINAEDIYQSTPLHFAAWNNKSSVAYILFKEGCNMECQDSCGKTAYDVAEYRSSFDVLEVFQDHGRESHQNMKMKTYSKYSNRLLQLKALQDILDSNENLREPGELDEYLSSLISESPTGILYDESEANEIRSVIDEFAINAARYLSESDPKLRCTVYYAGSSSEGTKTLYPDEFDYVVCFDELSENIYPQHEMGDVIESFHLIPDKETEKHEVLEEGVDFEETQSSVSDYTLIFLKKQTSYPYSELTELESKMIPNYMMFQTFTQRVSNIVFSENFPKDDRLLIKDISNDPKVILIWRGSKYKSLEINVDFVPAVRLPSWPNKSRISSKLLDPDQLRLPCLAVPKMTSHGDENLWRCSLSLVETTIMKRCLPHIRNSYIAAKSLISLPVCPLVSFGNYEEEKNYYRSRCDSMSSEEEFEMYEEVGNMFPSYILKMAFLHTIEERVVRESTQTVLEKILYMRDPLEHLVLKAPSKHIADKCKTDAVSKHIANKCKGCDTDVVKSVFNKCDEWLSNRFVPSFFNPRHNVLGSSILEENGVKIQYFIKYVLKLLQETE